MTDILSTSFRLPERTRATRLPPVRSKASSRGTITAQLPADRHARHIVFESKLEQRVYFILAARPDTLDIWDQPPAIIWKNGAGQQKHHHFDFLLTLRSGRRLAIAIKSSQVAARTGFRSDLQAIRAATPASYAQQIVLVTDRSFSRAEAMNAERLHEFRRTPDAEADAVIESLLRHLRTATRIATIVEVSGLGGRAFRAVFRSIYAGMARTMTTGLIEPSTFVTSEVVR